MRSSGRLPERVLSTPEVRITPLEVRLRWRIFTGRSGHAEVTVGFYGDDDGGSYLIEKMQSGKVRRPIFGRRFFAAGTTDKPI